MVLQKTSMKPDIGLQKLRSTEINRKTKVGLSFVSTAIKHIDDKNFELIDNFTLKDVTKKL